MDRPSYEKIIIEDPDFPVVVLENDKPHDTPRQQLCPLHWHEHLELHYITEGSLDIWVDQTQYSLHKGDLIVINSNDIHSSYCSGRLKERIIIFRLTDLSANLSAAVPGFQRVISGDSTISSFLAMFDSEYIPKRIGYEAACKATLLQLVVYLSRNYILSPVSDLEYRKHALLLQRFQPVMDYIQLHYAEPICSDELAALVYLSKDRFNHLFKECVGIPLRKYINVIRLHTAKDWLEKRLCGPAEAASQVGFTDYNHFGRLFRQTFGCTPSKITQNSAR